MSDRDLLEAAARASGMDGYAYCVPWRGMARTNGLGEFFGPTWNPLTDDGDEARLEAALGLDVEWWGTYSVRVGDSLERFADHGGDKQAARRRAGVRAAASLTQPEGGA